MSDEKRQTRLLPFRLRRTASASRGTDEGAEDFAADPELTALLRAWDAPPQDTHARARMLADFRARRHRAPLWRRVFAVELRVPLPVATCAALALLVSFFALGTRAWTHNAVAPPESAKTEAQPVVKVVEVPVVEERVVTRTVYVEKKERAGVRGVLSKPDASGLSAASDTDARREPEQQHQRANQGTQAGYFTHVDMEDFQPADELKIRIVKRGSTDEK
jgi:hypothetical protein